MNFRATLILIILISIIAPISIFLTQQEPQQEIEKVRTFLYTIPEEEIASLTKKLFSFNSFNNFLRASNLSNPI